ncbi:Glucosamine 6-phosphate N-acetyltransferase [Lachnellula suecica]|uniref:Glucosamine 6-phosphate N-acetyltransferase n=1 Tax=Lachnellula suecica TaxID=602035 RepID=A0A8T9C881_9HELO|nr:Glucosamine 6-phosphate N-acetyltransferase [Lachnellula suecica]
MTTPGEISLFSETLISSKPKESLPAGFICRPLYRSDYKRGHLGVLGDLAHIGDINEETWVERFDDMKKSNGTYFVLVIVDEKNDKIVGTGTFFYELKFLNNLGKQGHIEDIAVAKDYQGKGFGTILVHAVDSLGAQLGCYKTILDCSEAKRGFYLKCGYEGRGLEMHHYHDLAAKDHGV